MQRLINLLVLFISVFIVAVAVSIAMADVPKVELNEKGQSVLTLPAFDLYGTRSFGELVLYPDGHYTYTANPWECGFGPYYDAKKAACEAK